MPVYLSDRTEYVGAEIQIRTIGMDVWASLEHEYLLWKYASAIKNAEIDRQMQDRYKRIKASEGEKNDKNSVENSRRHFAESVSGLKQRR